MKRTCLVILVTAASVSFLGSAIGYVGKDESGTWPQRNQEHRQSSPNGSYFRLHGLDRPDISKGQYPELGECRIWFPDRPVGEQPPPGDCARFRPKDPAEVRIIHPPVENLDYDYLEAYNQQWSGDLGEERGFDAGSGSFVRVIFVR